MRLFFEGIKTLKIKSLMKDFFLRNWEKGRGQDLPETLSSEVGDDPGDDGEESVPEGRGGEGHPDPLGGESVVLGVLVHVPRLEGREEHRGRDTT